MSVISYIPAQNKYSNITVQISDRVDLNNEMSQCDYIFIEPVLTQGVRKAKNFTLNLEATAYRIDQQEDTAQLFYSQIFFALVYVPSGFQPLDLTVQLNQSVELYKANKYIILQGLLENGKVKKTYSYLARNLSAGDKICLILKPITVLNGYVLKFNAMLNYAIKYN